VSFLKKEKKVREARRVKDRKIRKRETAIIMAKKVISRPTVTLKKNSTITPKLKKKIKKPKLKDKRKEKTTINAITRTY
jgi:hypothetical protein